MYIEDSGNAILMYDNLSLAISSVGISSALLISIILKIKDRSAVISQLSERWGAASAVLLLYSLLSIESICLILNVIYGRDNNWIGVSTSALLFMGAITGAYIFRKGQGCPCFGAASTPKWVSPVLFGCLLLLSAAFFSHFIKSTFSHAFVATVSLMIASAFFIGNHSPKKKEAGTKIVLNRKGDEINDVVNSIELTVFVFASTSCPSCLALMRFIDKISIHLSGLGKFHIDIEGIAAEEDTTFAGCEVLRGEKLKARTLFSIDARPSIVVIRGHNAIKYVGFRPCALVLSELISIAALPS